MSPLENTSKYGGQGTSFADCWRRIQAAICVLDLVESRNKSAAVFLPMGCEQMMAYAFQCIDTCRDHNPVSTYGFLQSNNPAPLLHSTYLNITLQVEQLIKPDPKHCANTDRRGLNLLENTHVIIISVSISIIISGWRSSPAVTLHNTGVGFVSPAWRSFTCRFNN